MDYKVKFNGKKTYYVNFIQLVHVLLENMAHQCKHQYAVVLL